MALPERGIRRHYHPHFGKTNPKLRVAEDPDLEPVLWIGEGEGAVQVLGATANDLAVRRALVAAGVEFIDENGGGAGVRLRNRQRPKSPGRRP
jgi:hypothetical protein